MHSAYLPPRAHVSIYSSAALVLSFAIICLASLPHLAPAMLGGEFAAPAAAPAPLRFSPPLNTPPDGSLEAAGNGATFRFSSAGVELRTAAGPALAIEFPGANAEPHLRGAEQQNAAINSYRGSDSTAWHEDVPVYAAVIYEQLFAGVSLHYNGDARQLKGTYTVAPRADASIIRWRYADASQMRIEAGSGDLLIELNGQTLRERAPVAWQDTANGRRMVDARFVRHADGVGFGVGSYDAALPLVIDPEILYSSYLGGNSDEESKGIVRDAAGNLYIAGKTYSTDFGGSPNTIAGSDDIFVAKFDPSGKQLLYRTILGGKSAESSVGIAVNAAGEVAVTAYTSSLDFPLLKPLLATQPDMSGALFKLDAAGKLAFSTFLNIEMQEGQNIAFAQNGNMVFTAMDWAGATEGRENFGIYILKGDGSEAVQLRSFGGDWVDKGTALAIGPNGNIYIGGTTEFRDGGFPLSDNAFQKVCGAKSYGADDPDCDEDAFVAVLNATGTQVLHATFLGGAGSEDVAGVGVDNAGNVYVVGRTYSQNFPTKNAFQGSWLGADNFSNGFITKLNADLSAQLYSTFLGSQDQSGSDFIYGMALDGNGNLAVTGLTNGEYFPVKNATQEQLDGTICLGSNERFCHDAFVSSFDANGALTFSTYLGAYDDDIGYAIIGDGASGYWVTGRTEASDWVVTPDAAQPTAMMQSDSFVTHIGTRTGNQPGQQPGNPYRSFVPFTSR